MSRVLRAFFALSFLVVLVVRLVGETPAPRPAALISTDLHTTLGAAAPAVNPHTAYADGLQDALQLPVPQPEANEQNEPAAPNGLVAALQHVQQMRDAQASADAGATPGGRAGITSGSWTWLGPGDISGRVTAIAIHPTNPAIMFAGGAGSGLWKTVDTGASWVPVDDFMASLAVSSIVYNQGTPSIMYAGTGDGFPNPNGRDPVPGAGVFKSVDGGTTWAQLPSTNSAQWNYVNHLAIAPDNTTILAATGTGIYRSVDGGATWSQGLAGVTITHIAFPYWSSTLAVASGSAGDAYWTGDGGASWTAATGLGGGGRVEVAFASSGTVFASVDLNGGSFYSSSDYGHTYSLVFDGTPDYLDTTGGFSHTLWASPADPNFVVVGGKDLYKSLDAGVSWVKISAWQGVGSLDSSTSVHAGQHVIASPPSTNTSANTPVIFGTDGGIYRAADITTVGGGGALDCGQVCSPGWLRLNHNLGIAQFYGASVHPGTGKIVGGTVGNGTIVSSGAGPASWSPITLTHVGIGDGGFAAYDPNDVNIQYSSDPFLTLKRDVISGELNQKINGNSPSGATCNPAPYRLGDGVTEGCIPGLFYGIGANYVAPFILDPNFPGSQNTLLAGARSLWRTTDANTPNATTGPSWYSIKSPTSANGSAGYINAIAVAPLNSNIIWVGHNNGDVFKSTDGTNATPNWLKRDDVATPLPDRIVTRITVDPNDSNTVYVMFGGYNANNLYRTLDGGATWTPISGTGLTALPAAPVRDLKVHPTKATWLYAATEVGLFVSDDSGATWKVPTDGPANVSVEQLIFSGDTLYAVTHGRGIFKQTATTNTIISGQVTNAAGGAPLQGVPVAFYTTAGSGIDAGYTDASGNYSVTLPLGTYYAHTGNIQGFINQAYGNVACAGICAPISGTPIVAGTPTVTGVDFALNAGARISGNVTDSVTSLPIANAAVLVYDASQTFVDGSAADAAGSYITNVGLPNGTYLIKVVTNSGYIDEMYNNVPCLGGCDLLLGTPLNVSSAGTIPINFALDPGGTISGNITNASTSAPRPSISVYIYTPAGVFVGTGTSNGAGLYTSPPLPTGSYRLLTVGGNAFGLEDLLYQNINCYLGGCTVANGTPVSVTAPTPVTGINFALPLIGPHVTAQSTNPRFGGSATFAVANAPGAPANFVALFCPPSTADNSYGTNWAYLNGTQTLPLTGLTTGTVFLTMPTTVGDTCEARLFSAFPGGTKLATSQVVTASNPVPYVFALSPSGVVVNSPAFTMTVSGVEFVPGSVVQFDGTPRSTTYVSTNQLTTGFLATELTALGTHQITVVNPAPGGGTSTNVTFSVTTAPPVPTLTSINPTSQPGGGPSTGLTVTGTGFAGNSVVRVDGIPRLTFLNAGQLTTQINESELSTLGTRQITVFTPAPGGGLSNSTPFTVTQPFAPSVFSISPSNVSAGGTSFQLTVSGSTFMANSVVRIAGNNRPTTYVSSNTLTAFITDTDITLSGVRQIDVVTPAPGGGTSASSVPLTVTSTGPTISVSGTVAPSGTITASLSNGPGLPTDQVFLYCPSSLPDVPLPSTWKYLNNTQVVPASVNASATLTFVAPPTAGVVCNVRWRSGGSLLVTSQTITLINPAPSAFGLTPPFVAAGTAPFTLTVGGTGFAPGSVILWDGANRTTTYVSSNAVTTPISALDVQDVLFHTVAVFNPTPGGGTSGNLTFAATPPPPAPTIVSISPNNVSAGSASFQMTVTGTNFYSNSELRLDGVARSTNVITPSFLTATILASDIAAGGTRSITVFTPSPGGGLSNSTPLTVNAPTLTVAPGVSPGGTISVAVTNGPGINTNWVALFCPSTQPDDTYVDWKRLDNTQVTPLVGFTNAVVTFTAPSIVGTVCNARLFSVGVKIATSGTITVSLNNPVPSVLSLTPSSVVQGTAPAPSIAVNGVNFVPTSIVRLNGVDRPTTFVSSTQVMAALTIFDVQNNGMYAIDVFNPAPGGGLSLNSTPLTVTVPPPAPTLINISPVNVTAGGASFPLVATGSDFAPNSVVRINGVPRATVFGSASQLTATILQSDIASGGTRAITVSTPAPGGGNSSAATLTVIAPTLTVASTVNPGALISVTVANGPGINTNWVGLFCPSSSPDDTYVDWKRLDNTQVTPLVGLTNAVVTLLAPSTVGTVCNVRFFSLGVKLATSATITVAVSNPVPSVISLLPVSVVQGVAPPPTVTVNGTNFVANSVVRVDGVDRLTTFVTSTQLLAALTTPDVQNIGTLAITVFNPAPGGGLSLNSSPLTVTVPPPAPILTGSIPANVSAGGPAFSLVATGSNFTPNSIVRIDGLNRATTFNSSTSLTATILSTDRLVSGIHPITVLTPGPGGGVSGNSTTLTVIGPTITTGPTVAPGATLVFNLSNGPGLATNWVALYCPATTPDGAYIDWKYLNNTQALPGTGLTTATITFTAPTNPGDTCNLRWTSAGVKIATSITVTVAVTNPVPSVTSLSPPSVVQGVAPPPTITVNGTNFVPTSVVRVDGVDRLTTFVTSTQLLAALTTPDVQNIGTLALTVFNPAPAGGLSLNSTPLTVTAPPPAPTLTNISPSNVSAGGASFPIVATGTNFTPNSVVRIDGLPRATVFGSANQLTATMLAADISSGGTHAITVTTPAPGGGNSSAATLTVVGPTLSVASTVNPGALVTVTVANGPGINSNWVALFCPSSAPDSTYVDWKRLDNTQVTPLVGLTDAVVTLMAPSTVGTVCNVRFFSLGVKIATSTPITVAVSNPVPSVIAVLPSSVVQGVAPPPTVTVTGTNFVPTSVVRVDGVDRLTTFLTSTQLLAALTTPDVQNIGTLAITVFNPAPGGGLSLNSTPLTVTAPPPAPTLTNISPSNVSAGGASFPLVATGTNFTPNSVVRVDGLPRVTVFGSANQLTATMLAADISSGGTHAITVTTPAPGGGNSSPATLTVVGPTLSVASTVNPGALVTVTVANGPGINSNWVALFCPSSAPDDTYVDWKRLDNTQVTPLVGLTNAVVTLMAPSTVGTVCNVRFFSLGVKIATSTTITVAVTNPVPTVTTLLPSSVVQGVAPLPAVTVNGTNFVATSMVRVNGTDRTTTFVSSTQLLAALTAPDVQNIGTLAFTVFNPAPGGGLSLNSSSLTVTAPPPAPTLTNISPSNVSAGGASFPLVATGTNFTPNSVVRIDGLPRVTVFGSANQLTATMLAADISSGGTHAITVTTPAPGGGNSSPATLTVVGPTLSVASTVNPGGLVSVTVANGPGINTNWVALFCPSSSPDSTYVDWKRLDNTQVTPLVGLTDAVVTLMAPSTVGTVCNVRFFSLGVKIATSTPITVAVSNPVPSVIAVLPSSVVQGVAPPPTVTVTGTNFVPTSVVRVDGVDRLTTFVTSTQLLAALTTPDVQNIGTLAITVFNPAPGGGLSLNSTPLTVTAPPAAPTLTNISPSNVSAGGASFPLVATGANFTPNSVVRIDGLPRATVFGSANQLTATMLAADISSGGTHAITVTTPAPGGGNSSAATLTVVGPTLSVAATVNPGALISVTVANGPGINTNWVGLFCPSSSPDDTYVDWKRLDNTQVTPLVGLTNAVVTLMAPSTVGTVCNVRFFSLGVKIATSTTITVAVSNPVPSVLAVLPSNVVQGVAPPPTVTVTGTNFVPTSVVRVNGVDRLTTFLTSTQLLAALTTPDVQNIGTLAITVFNPAPGGGLSLNSTPLTVTAPPAAPTLINISPTNVSAGGASFPLVATGTNFTPNSVVRVDGAPRATIFGSASQLTATILAGDIASGGTHAITVTTPAPGGGNSSAATLTVVGPTLSVASTVNPGGLVSVTVANGPGINTNWVALFCPSSSPDDTYVDWKRLDNTQVTPLVGLTNAVVTLLAPTTVGTVCNVRFFSLGVKIATSTTITVAVTNPVPSVIAVLPSSVVQGVAPPPTVTVTGTNFVPTSVVRVDGVDRLTTFLTSTQLLAALTTPDVQNIGTLAITVFNPAPGGGLSLNSTPLTVTAPPAAPTLTNISPSNVSAGGASFPLVATGTNFTPNSVVRIDGLPRVTVFGSASQLTATMLAADIASGGTHAITVTTPAPGGGNSSPATLTVVGPTLSVASTVNPGGLVSVTVANGPGINTNWVALFCPSSSPDDTYVDWKRLDNTQVTPLVGLTNAVVTLLAPSTVGTVCNVRFFSLGVKIATSTTITVAVTNPVPSVLSLLPASVVQGVVPPPTVTVNGTNFVPASKVRVDGVDRTTTFVTSTQLLAALTTPDVQNIGTLAITVFNPAPGGGLSLNSTPLTVTAPPPAPTLTNISPSNVSAGGASFPLVATGANFTPNSVVRVDGLPRATVFGSANQLTATMLAADISSGGTHAITVTTPAPGGGNSSPATLTVLGPTLTVASTVNPGGLVSVTVANGPGINTNWVALFCPSTQPDDTYVDWKRLDNTQVTPLVGLTNAVVTLMAPSTVGTVCNVRFFSLGVKIATSTTITIAVTNPVPSVISLLPASVVQGVAPPPAIAVNGSNFVANSVVRVDGVDRLTTFVTSTQLLAALTAPDVQNIGTLAITVFNPAPGGGLSLNSSPLTVTVAPPAPILTGSIPANVSAGGPAFSLVATGSNFTPNSIVRIDGLNRATTFNSSTSLTATILSTDRLVSGIHPITVLTPGPGGGVSGNSTTLTVIGPTLSVASAVSPGGTISVTVANGPGINSNWVGLFCPSTQPDDTYVDWKRLDNTQVTPLVGLTNAVVTLTAPSTVGTVCNVRFFSLGVKIATSTTITIAVTNPVPSVLSLLPSSVVQGVAPPPTVTVNGTNFVPTSKVRVDGVDRTTTFVTSTQLLAALTVPDVQNIGTLAITVFNPSPGGGVSLNSTPLTVTAPPPAPTLANISPSNVSAGSNTLTLWANGANFTPNSVVRVDGAPRATSFNSASQLVATLLTGDIASGGSRAITVTTPAPGGGNSSAVTLTVMPPTLSAAATVSPGGLLSVTVANGPGINTNWVGLFCPSTAPDDTYVDWKRLDNTQVTPPQGLNNAVVTLMAPSTVGMVCNVRFFSLGVKIATSAPITVAVTNPVPSIVIASPPTVYAGAAITATLLGDNFIPASVVRVNGVDRVTTFVSAFQLNVAITAADTQTIGSTLVMTVFNPPPAGGLSLPSSPITVIAPPPPPTLSGISPFTVSSLGASFPLVVTGSNFVDTSVVRIDGAPRVTAFNASYQLTATILASDIASGGTHAITVTTPAPGGGNSSAATLTVTGPSLSVSPTVLPGGTISVTVADGPGINTNWVGLFCPSSSPDDTFIDWKRLDNTQVTPAVGLVNGVVTFTAPLTANTVCNARFFSVGAKIATSSTITVVNPVPTLTNVSPLFRTATGPQFTLTVFGTNFVSGSIVQVAGVNKSTSFVSATQLTATVPATDILTAGTRTVTVFNPAPGGGSSVGLFFIVNAAPPQPTLTNISPSNVSSGGASFPMLVTGSGFDGTSVVKLDGNNRATVFNSATSLTATILASDITSSGAHAITVFTPSPGGGSSNSSTLTVTGPCLDTDGDRLCDSVETNTGVFVNASNTGTNPNVADTDGDGIKDGDEVLGTLGGLNLPLMGTNPLKKNILLEYDWVDDNSHSHRPTQAMADRVAAAFLASTNVNPDGSTGITVLQDYGQGAPFTGGNLLSHGADIVGGVNNADFIAVKAANFAANRQGYFHYVEMAHTYGGGNSSGQAELPGNDLIVTLGNVYYVTEYVANTIMHELGHNLSLRHGGNEDCNWKPNYNSVMNYRFQFYGIDTSCDARSEYPVSNPLDYSRGTRISLDENNLNENAGVCGATPIDWNFSSSITTPVAFDLNQVDEFPTVSTTTDNAFCTSDVNGRGVLNDYNDWARIDTTLGIGLGDSDGATFFGAILKMFQENIDCENPLFSRLSQR